MDDYRIMVIANLTIAMNHATGENKAELYYGSGLIQFAEFISTCYRAQCPADTCAFAIFSAWMIVSRYMD